MMNIFRNISFVELNVSKLMIYSMDNVEMAKVLWY
jgi:hypothetical protein